MRYLGMLTNARFLDVGANRVVVAGTTRGVEGRPDGSTFYTEPVDEIDGNIAKCGDGYFRFQRNLQHAA
ncbi:hypothetical protein [Shinella zoogloeoides]|uniref:hypothetical protein n=1 Tax=Shinella zoogloeoides TaxID=352475 RepID=UPI00273F7E76|nr:hypothetical protein [Shinella zoogloeoides]WLR90921.1 hypothetical protein Q9316_00660 [Shinella zoogloeoides]